MLMHDVSWFDKLGDAKVCNLDVSLTIKEDVVELDVSMKDPLSVDVPKSFDDLFEEHFSDILI